MVIFNKKIRRGFTLIELLVVIAIIGILSSVVLASLNTARAKSRDTQRISNMEQVRVALEFYFDENNTYPSTSGSWWGNCSSYGSHGTSGSNGWVPNIAPTYIPILPLDPRPSGANGCHLYRSNGTDYKLLIHQTVESIPCPPIASTHAMYDPPRSASQCTLSFYSPGAKTW